jgi:hypothetical protein
MAKKKSSVGKVTQAKEYEIVKAGKNPILEIDGKAILFNKQGVIHTDDAGLAHAINQKYGHQTKTGNGDAVVIPLEKYNEHRSRDRKEVYYHTVPALPWHRYDENGRRIRE